MSADSRAEPGLHHEHRRIFASLGLAVVDFRCRAPVAKEGGEEPNATHSIVLVRRGLFRRLRQREAVLADASNLLSFNAAEPYRFSHPVPGGDDCTIITVETERALELVRRHAPREAEDPARPFRRGHALASPELARLHYELLWRIRAGHPTLLLEDALADLAGAAVRALCAPAADAAAGAARIRPRHRELAEAVVIAVHERIESPPSLAELASSAGCSPYHLSRTFRRTVGVSLRRYASQLRARVAAERLAGARDLTRLALELGYADHGHFTNAFRREWGLPPSRFRARTGSGEPDKKSQARGVRRAETR